MAGRAGKSYLPWRRDASRTPLLFNLSLEEAYLGRRRDAQDVLRGFSVLRTVLSTPWIRFLLAFFSETESLSNNSFPCLGMH